MVLAEAMTKLATSTPPTSTTSTPRKLSHLATSAPSRGSSSFESRLQVELPRTGWRSTLWPSSPVLRKKLHLASASEHSVTNSSNNHVATSPESELMSPIPLTLKRQSGHRLNEPQDDDDVLDAADSLNFDKRVRGSTLLGLSNLEDALPIVSVRLHGGNFQVQSAQQVSPLQLKSPSRVSPFANLQSQQRSSSSSNNVHHAPSPPLSHEQLVKRNALEQELEEFRRNTDSKIVMFPDYFAEDEKELVQQVAEELRLGYQVGERNIAVFKTGLGDKTRSFPSAHAVARSRLSLSGGGSGDAMGDDVYVDVSELALQGKDCFIARLRLRRLNSGSGVRRNMLWDVAQLSQADGIADPVAEGEGGVYAVQSRASGQKLAMFKPAEEEKFVREGLFPGEGAVREEAVYVLDSRSSGFSGVPPTAVARLQLSNIGRSKQGAVQRFMTSSIGSMEGFGMPFDLEKAEAFVPVEQVHRIGLLDVRVFNTDRHPGNILLIGEKAPFTMVPIDHGCILPSWFHLSEARFDWLEYPQCKVPFSAQAMDYIESLDADADALALRRLGIREECVTTLKICTLFLQRAAQAGKTLFWIGSYMQRAGCFETPSELELLIQRACDATGIPFTFVLSEFSEQKGSIPLGILSRRPPKQFFDSLEQLVVEATT
ncbi:hypothetical protein Gpo141_00001068 [Globisporangium polare]